MLDSIIFFGIVVFTNFFIFYFYKPIVNIYNLYDVPDFERKLHKKKIPLLGGLFLSINLLLIMLLSFIYPEILDGNLYHFIF